MSFSYDIGTLVGKVRFWIRDTTEATAIFTDEEINFLLTEHANDARQAAASALISLASDKARLGKMKKAGAYMEDTRSIAKELREQAQALLDSASEPYEDVAEQTFGPLVNPLDGSGEREYIEREDLRGEI